MVALRRVSKKSPCAWRTAGKRYEDKVSDVKLSICIATYNRGKFIGETLDSILSQVRPGIEIIIVDGASPDSTPVVLNQYLLRHPEVRYYREQKNCGVDEDYDKAVGYAVGEYCWLMTDDDLLRAGAVSRVLSALEDKSDLVIVNAEVRNADFSRVLEKSLINLPFNRRYGPGDSEKCFSETGRGLSFIGCVVIKRGLWLSRNRSSYYGTLFIHVGVIFQNPAIEKVKVLAEPLIVIRYGNAMWSVRGFEIWTLKWPELIWSFVQFSDCSKAAICPREPWTDAKKLVLYRAIGAYSSAEYRLFLADKARGIQRLLPLLIANTPAWLINSLASIYILLFNRNARTGMYDISRSRHSTWISRVVAQIIGV
jgi:abequosyltransferase